MQMGFSLFDSVSGWDHHLGFELVLFSLRYRAFYLESLRAGFGTQAPASFSPVPRNYAPASARCGASPRSSAASAE